jgi:hypothetical protein
MGDFSAPNSPSHSAFVMPTPLYFLLFQKKNSKKLGGGLRYFLYYLQYLSQVKLGKVETDTH